MRALLIFVTGLIFGLGIAISGMANPAKVLNFFDIAGAWDPSLLLVMISAMVTAMAGYRLVFRRSRPIFGNSFHLPDKKVIDGSLIGGSALFGIGWGIAGFCPGGAIPALGLGRPEPFIFLAALLAGMVLARAMRTLPNDDVKAAA
jgi:uncharacterized protein